MKQFKVEGMTCASCQAHVEKAVAGVPGVTSVSVSLLTNSMGVEGDATNEAIIKAVEDAGYGASPKGADGTSAKPASDDALKDTETPKLKRRLVYSIGFLLVLMYLTMGHNMLHFPLPAFLDGNLYGMGITQLLLALIVPARAIYAIKRFCRYCNLQTCIRSLRWRWFNIFSFAYCMKIGIL